MKHINKKSGFESPNDWNDFKNYLINENRYVLKARWIRFLKTLRKTAIKRTGRIRKSLQLVRARIGSHYEEYENEEGIPQIYFGPLSPKELGAPPKDKTKDGRANPKGIPYLYLSNKVETAIAEARPWIKANVSVGYFQTRKNLKVLNLLSDKPKMYFGDFDLITGKKIECKYTQEELEAYIWGDLNKAFSLPVQPGAEDEYYIPTQFVAEFFKNRGYNGIIYKSSVDESGYNIVLFNPKYARLKSARIFEMSTIKYEHKESGNPYAVAKKRTKK